MHFFRSCIGKLRDKPRERFKDLENKEPLKEVCSNSRSSAILAFHPLSFASSASNSSSASTLCQNIRWAPFHPTPEELDTLQFTAKAHKSLIVISLTDILLRQIRYGLLNQISIPLNFISSPFNIGFSLRYLVSQIFWCATLNPTSNRLFYGVTAAVVLIFALMGLTEGPSSAIAMIPRYDWWQLSVTPYYRSLVKQDPYSTKFDSQQVLEHKTCVIIDDQTCVNQNLSTTLQILGTLFLQEQSFQGQIAYAVTPMEFVLDSLAGDVFLYDEPQTLIRSEALKPSGKEKWKQPLVAVHCAENRVLRSLNETSATFGLGDWLYDNFTVTLKFNNTLEFLKNISTDPDSEDYRPLNTTALDIQYLLPVLIIASMLLTYSFLDIDSSSTPDDEHFVPWIDLKLCLVQARWVEAEIWLYRKESSNRQSRLEFPLDDALKYMRKKSDIKADSELYSPSPSPNYTAIYNTFFQHVYACGFRVSTTIQLTFSALLLQILIALLHLAVTVFARKSWTCYAWGSFGQLLTLALQSKAPDRLSNVGSGVQRSHTWKLMTVVRDVGEERQLEMVLGARTGMALQDQSNMDVEERGAT
ncbi:hypothetical protein EDB81DRAFT_764304 [Dactylonectria macrodidyma]|uniref:Uncharacterized protein n=1 Tax=Dactylonectria macrodidyma TaxID=307937 RepID=A0A9P9IS42_9HYPO|nr:hypothetical protein EDB81DRAFT_764304 [Dactylonectria macrodidyma]